jgi:adenine-specific DNA-methyltransferase
MNKKVRLLKLRSILKSTTTQDGRKNLEELGIKSFDYPKPVLLIKEFLDYFNNKNATVLDFFAGSGTTFQSVIEANKDDGGKRICILCTSNEYDDRNKNGIAVDTTFTRIRKANEIKNGSKDSLICFDISEVSTKDPEVFDVIESENYGKNFKTKKEKIEWICSNFLNTTKELEK